MTQLTDLTPVDDGIRIGYAMTELEHRGIPFYDLEVNLGSAAATSVAGYMHFTGGQVALFLRREKHWVVRLSQPFGDGTVAALKRSAGDGFAVDTNEPCMRRGQRYYLSSHQALVYFVDHLIGLHGARKPANASEVRDYVFMRPSFLTEPKWASRPLSAA